MTEDPSLYRPVDTRTRGERVHLGFLDGLRGLAAVYVVLHHAGLEVTHTEGGERLSAWLAVLKPGHSAVAVFIVLSGFSLMLPVLGDPSGALRGGFVGYLRRRAWRILPAYYAALCACMLLVFFVPGMSSRLGDRWDFALPGLTFGALSAHIALLHNTRLVWMYQLDPPMWSVAMEWQIYLAFPLLLAVRRRAGVIATTVVALAAGYAAAGLAELSGHRGLTYSCPWYLGLFAMGMAVAVLTGPAQGGGASPATRASWSVLTVVLAFAAVTAVTVAPEWYALTDPVVGAWAACLIGQSAARARLTAGSPRPLVSRLLESRGAIFLGSFSYSLYLVHFPILSTVHRLLASWNWRLEARLAGLFLGAVPLSFGVAYAFHRVFERPFLPAARSIPSLFGSAAPQRSA